MTEVICEVLRRNKLTNAYIRPIISRGVGDLALIPQVPETFRYCDSNQLGRNVW